VRDRQRLDRVHEALATAAGPDCQDNSGPTLVGARAMLRRPAAGVKRSRFGAK
jgi:hypothetical protein